MEDGLIFKAHQVAEYLVERFNNDFSNRGITKLYIEKTYLEDGYYIKFENKHIYYDIRLLAKKGNDLKDFGKYFLGTFTIHLLSDTTSKLDYYIYFLCIMRKLFIKQSEFNRNYELTSPILIHEIDVYFDKKNISNRVRL